MELICCKPYFKVNEPLPPVSETCRYLSLDDLCQLDRMRIKILKKMVCAVANNIGGTIFFGAVVGGKGNVLASGLKLTEDQKQAIKKVINRISQLFYPTLKASKRELVVDYPAMIDQVGAVCQGRHLVRINVRPPGKYFYSFTNDPTIKYSKPINYFYQFQKDKIELCNDMALIYERILQKHRSKGITYQHKCISQAPQLKPLYRRVGQLKQLQIFQAIKNDRPYFVDVQQMSRLDPVENQPAGLVKQVSIWQIMQKQQKQIKKQSAESTGNQTLKEQQIKFLIQCSNTQGDWKLAIKGFKKRQALKVLYNTMKKTLEQRVLKQLKCDEQQLMLLLTLSKQQAPQIYKSLQNSLLQKIELKLNEKLSCQRID